MRLRFRIPSQQYETVVADPPWSLRTGGAMRKLVYDTMTIEEIYEIGDQLEGKLADECHLWLWTTNPHLPEALMVMKSWGFQYKSLRTWNKRRIGIGWWLRSQTEHLLLGVRGNPKSPGARGVLGGLSTYFEYPYRGHSVKPPEIYPDIEQLSPGPYLELFSHPGRTREGWTMLSSPHAPIGDPYGKGYEAQQCRGCPHPLHLGVCDILDADIGGACPCSFDEDDDDLAYAEQIRFHW